MTKPAGCPLSPLARADYRAGPPVVSAGRATSRHAQRAGSKGVLMLPPQKLSSKIFNRRRSPQGRVSTPSDREGGSVRAAALPPRGRTRRGSARGSKGRGAAPFSTLILRATLLAASTTPEIALAVARLTAARICSTRPAVAHAPLVEGPSAGPRPLPLEGFEHDDPPPRART